MFPLGWNGLNTMQVQILPPINNINSNLTWTTLKLTRFKPLIIF
jgi:hypothetical protein